MELEIKQLSQNGKIFVPQTTAEAVLVKNENEVTTLDTALSKKQPIIITPAGSGLVQYSQTDSVIITHSNTVTATDTLQNMLISHDGHGHITKSVPVGKTIITINGTSVITSGNISDQSLNFGENFELDSNKDVQLKWNNL